MFVKKQNSPEKSGLESTFFKKLFICLFVYLFIYLFIYVWLCWVFVSVRGLSLVAASGGHSSSWCAGLSLSRPLLFQSTSPRRAGSVVVAHWLSCSAACGIFPDQGSNPRPLHWQADSQPLCHQGSPRVHFWSHFPNRIFFYHDEAIWALSVFFSSPVFALRKVKQIRTEPIHKVTIVMDCHPGVQGQCLLLAAALKSIAKIAWHKVLRVGKPTPVNWKCIQS